MRLIFQRRRQRHRGERGQALVEFGLVAIVFLLLVFGIMDMARLFQSWVAIQHAAREGARYAITGQINCSAYPTGDHRNDCIIDKAEDHTTGLSGGGEDGSNVEVTYQAWDYMGTTWDATGTANQTGKQCDQLEVTVRYHHHFLTPLLTTIAPSGFWIQGSQRMTNEPYGQCNIDDGFG